MTNQFPSLPETARRPQIKAVYAILSECENWSEYGFIRWWINNPRSMSLDIDNLMDKYAVIRDGHSADGEMVKFINSNRTLMDKAYAVYEEFDK